MTFMFFSMKLAALSADNAGNYDSMDDATIASLMKVYPTFDHNHHMPCIAHRDQPSSAR